MPEYKPQLLRLVALARKGLETDAIATAATNVAKKTYLLADRAEGLKAIAERYERALREIDAMDICPIRIGTIAREALEEKP